MAYTNPQRKQGRLNAGPCLRCGFVWSGLACAAGSCGPALLALRVRVGVWGCGGVGVWGCGDHESSGKAVLSARSAVGTIAQVVSYPVPPVNPVLNSASVRAVANVAAAKRRTDQNTAGQAEPLHHKGGLGIGSKPSRGSPALMRSPASGLIPMSLPGNTLDTITVMYTNALDFRKGHPYTCDWRGDRR